MGEITTAIATDSASAKYSLNKFDWKSIGMGAIDASGGALLTYATTVISGLDVGIWTPTIMFFWTNFSKMARKWLSDGSVPVADQKK